MVMILKVVRTKREKFWKRSFISTLGLLPRLIPHDRALQKRPTNRSNFKTLCFCFRLDGKHNVWYLKHKYTMTGDCYVFNFLRCSVDGKHLTLFKLLRRSLRYTISQRTSFLTFCFWLFIVIPVQLRSKTAYTTLCPIGSSDSQSACKALPIQLALTSLEMYSWIRRYSHRHPRNIRNFFPKPITNVQNCYTDN